MKIFHLLQLKLQVMFQHVFYNSFDFFLFNQTLEHLYNPFHAVENIYKIVKPGGYVFTSVPTLNIPHMTPVHFNGFTPMGLAMLFLSAGFEIVDETKMSERKSICKECEHWISSAWNGTGKCKLCGCSTWAKIRIATEKCPIGKW